MYSTQVGVYSTVQRITYVSTVYGILRQLIFIYSTVESRYKSTEGPR